VAGRGLHSPRFEADTEAARVDLLDRAVIWRPDPSARAWREVVGPAASDMEASRAGLLTVNAAERTKSDGGTGGDPARSKRAAVARTASSDNRCGVEKWSECPQGIGGGRSTDRPGRTTSPPGREGWEGIAARFTGAARKWTGNPRHCAGTRPSVFATVVVARLQWWLTRPLVWFCRLRVDRSRIR
jgi:hypothetical protein